MPSPSAESGVSSFAHVFEDSKSSMTLVPEVEKAFVPVLGFAQSQSVAFGAAAVRPGTKPVDAGSGRREKFP